MLISLDPLVHKDAYNAPLEGELVAYFKETIFDGLKAALDRRTHEAVIPNSAVLTAITSGAIYYDGSAFIGSFNAAISRELRSYGARLVNGRFVLDRHEIPLVLRTAIDQAQRESRDAHKAALALLAAIGANAMLAPSGIRAEDVVKGLVKDLDHEMGASVAGVNSITLPESEGLRDSMTDRLRLSTDRAVRDFTLEETERLRALVQANLDSGASLVRLTDIIQAEFGVTQRKARFLAEQETSLAIAQYREERYRAVGSTTYIWQTVEDEKVRHGHAILNKRVFSWDNPPITDPATGRRCHPGQDFNCRCTAIPLIATHSSNV